MKERKPSSKHHVKGVHYYVPQIGSIIWRVIDTHYFAHPFERPREQTKIILRLVAPVHFSPTIMDYFLSVLLAMKTSFKGSRGAPKKRFNQYNLAELNQTLRRSDFWKFSRKLYILRHLIHEKVELPSFLRNRLQNYSNWSNGSISKI